MTENKGCWTSVLREIVSSPRSDEKVRFAIIPDSSKQINVDPLAIIGTSQSLQNLNHCRILIIPRTIVPGKLHHDTIRREKYLNKA